jgi:hypothetical protein
MQAALKAFSEAQEQPRPAEVSNVAFAIAKGAPPEQALKLVIGNRGSVAATPAPSPDAAFNAKYGLAQPTVDQTKFPKGMRGKVGSAQSVTVPPTDTPTPQELLQGGAAEADFARNYANGRTTPETTIAQPMAAESISEPVQEQPSTPSRRSRSKEWWVRGPHDTIIRFDRAANRFTIDGVSESFYSRGAAEEYILNRSPRR